MVSGKGNLRFADDERGKYNGKYEYHHDPERRNVKTEAGWYFTDCGQARGSNRENGGENEPTRIIRHVDLIERPSPELCKKVLENSLNVRDFVSFGIPDCFSAADEVYSQLGNHREKYKNVDRYIVDFADMNMRNSGHVLSFYTAVRNRLSHDFRMDIGRIPRLDRKFLEDYSDYILHEQEVIRMSGIVDKDGMLTLFRNTDGRQIANMGNCELGMETKYKGNNIESWTTKPTLRWSSQTGSTKKVMAKVPLYACIASCIGRREKPFMVKRECEIMVCGAFVKSVQLVGIDSVEIKEIYEGYLKDVMNNMTRFANGTMDTSPKSKKGSVDPILEQIFRESIKLRGI